VTETSDLTAAGEIAVLCGQAWTFSHVGRDIRGKFSAWLKSRARAGLQEERQQGILNAAGYREEADALKRQFDAGAYNWGSPTHARGMGEAVATALESGDGLRYLVQLLLEANHGPVPVEKIDELCEADAALLSQTIKSCLDPNRKAPASPSQLGPGPTPGTTNGTAPAEKV
jgi:hypothetical protein